MYMKTAKPHNDNMQFKPQSSAFGNMQIILNLKLSNLIQMILYQVMKDKRKEKTEFIK